MSSCPNLGTLKLELLHNVVTWSRNALFPLVHDPKETRLGLSQTHQLVTRMARRAGDGIDTTMLRFMRHTNGSISLGKTPSDLVAKSVSKGAAGDDITIVAAVS